MIFEANFTEVKKALTLIQNTLTATELKKEEFTMIQLHVEEEIAYFSCEVEGQMEYQVNIAEAEPVLEGQLLVNLRDLMDVIKSFDKNSMTLLFERDGMELRIDDGVLTPEMIVLSEQNELEEGFSLSQPKQSLSFPLKWFTERMELARINNRTTFLPATSSVVMYVEDNQFVLRSFNLTNLYESRRVIEGSFTNQAFLIGKNASSRLSRLLKTVKEESIQLYWDKTSLYVFAGDFVFRFQEEHQEDGIAILSSLPIEGMKITQTNTSFKTSEFKKYTTVVKGEETPEVLGVNAENGEIIAQPHIALPSERTSHYYPFKLVQKIVSKWMTTLEVSIGTEENCSPLIIQHKSNETSDAFILMGYDQSQEILSDEEPEEETE